MAGNHTSNYQLNQWEPEDKVLREEFNEDNLKLDAALGALSEKVPKIAAGHYTGNGEASQTFYLGFTPKAVFTCTEEGITYQNVRSGYLYGGLAVTGGPVRHTNSAGYTGVEIATWGFRVYQVAIDDYCGVYCNKADRHYRYVAIG